MSRDEVEQPGRASAAWAGIRPRTTASRQPPGDGENPAPRHVGSRGHPPPSASVSSRGKERMNGPGDAIAPADRCARASSLAEQIDGSLPAAPRRGAAMPAGVVGAPARGRRRPPDVHHLLTFGCQAGDHGGNPPPRRKGARGHPSAHLSSGGKGRAHPPSAAQADRSPAITPPTERICNRGLSIRLAGRMIRPLVRASRGRVRPPAARPFVSAVEQQRQPEVYHLLTFGCQAGDHGGNPPPRGKGARGHPSAHLSSGGKGRAHPPPPHKPTAAPRSPRRPNASVTGGFPSDGRAG
jgi:hypothetical protein